jgi:hypothetical protein
VNLPLSAGDDPLDRSQSGTSAAMSDRSRGHRSRWRSFDGSLVSQQSFEQVLALLL